MNNLNCRHLLSHIPLQSHCRFKTTQTSTEYCLDLIRKYDYENFICTLLLKNTSRSVALAVRGFNVEVAKVPEQVSQSNIGLMRLKFWEEVIDKCYSKDLKQVPQHPVAIELFKAITKANLSKRYLKNLVSARQSIINTQSIKTLEDIEKYADQTVSSIYYLILEGCGIRNMDADHAASHLGKAQGIVQQLRSIPHSKELNFIPIPQDVLIKYQVSQEAVLRGHNSQNLSDCVFEIASRAHQHLQKTRSLGDKVPKDGKIAFLPAVPVSIYLSRLQQVDYNVLDSRLVHRSWKLLPTVYWYMLKNTY
ncbi:NADH dehydrogenase (ubiquinone) complex I, assembly factor 6 isoform X1 [Euwallacea fornicatus]|uniref:NADH dehydrogenase (ubiquinone) complex I, assembly factor 6 isoform X1 n=1 Tax=Euwallacea fornicatus TaxID=995702 RepID=UPI00338E6397